METLILVDENDNEIGTASREECHNGEGIRHRAFVVFLFNSKKELLVQFRSAHKLGGSRWDVSCTSHVRKGETYDTASVRCMSYEIGIKAPVEKVFGYTYTENYEGRAENEYCSLLIGTSDDSVTPNKDEMDEVKYINVKELASDMKTNPENYTKWFRIAMDQFLAHESSKQYL